MIPTATCQYCHWKGPVDECGQLHNAWERVQPGDPMPAGECPKCNASAMLDEDKPEPRIKIVTTPGPLSATKFGLRTTAQGLANVMSLAGNKWSYRVQDVHLSGFRVAVYRKTPHPDTVPQGYLRIVPA